MRLEDRAGVLEARMLLVHVGAEVGEDAERLRTMRRDLGIDLGVAEVGRVGDAQARDAALEAGAPVARLVGQRVPVARVGQRRSREHQRGVGDGARHRPDMRDGAEGRQRPGRHAAEGRLEAEEPGEARTGCGSSRRRRCRPRAGPCRQATAAAAPPEEPPGVFAGFHGLRVMPVSGLSVTPFQPNSGVVVLPSSTAPCSRSRAVAGASSFHGPFGSTVFEPRSVGQPRVRMMSLIDTGTPSSRPCGCPLHQRASEAFASSSAWSETRLKALSRGLSASMRASTALVTSTGESVCVR